MIFSKVALGVVAGAFLAGYAAGEWRTIFSCTGPRPASGDRVADKNWVELAQKSVGVRICSAGSETDCVVATGDNVALSNLRAGNMNLQDTSLDRCDRACIDKIWTGPLDKRIRLNWSCKVNGDGNFYHACGNGNGLHMGKTHGGCEWNYFKSVDSLVIQVDYRPPTPAPTEKKGAAGCKGLPAQVTDCGEYAEKGRDRECWLRGAGCVSTDLNGAWFSKTNTANPNQRVNAQQICKDQGYDGADARYYGGNWGRMCGHPGWNWWHYNKAGGPLQNLGSSVTWWCHGTKHCEEEPETVVDPNPCNGEQDLGKFFINDCEKKCVCERVGEVYEHKCYCEREEFTDMSDDRRERFINTFKAISTPGHESYGAYVELINLHPNGSLGASDNKIHNDQYFLIWHRWYVKAIEDLLQKEDCRVTMPWWRWSRKSTGWQEGAPFLDEDYWLGRNDKEDCVAWTWGGPSGCCVTSGPFAYPGWSPAETTWDGCMRREFTSWSMPTVTQITTVQNLPADNFVGYTRALEHSVHNVVHGRIGGDMGSMSSPKNPEFFLHHAYIDRLWDQWQRKSSAHMESYGSWPRDIALDYTAGVTPNKPNDHFELKHSGVMYVDVQSVPGEQRRRLVGGKQPKPLPPMGNWIVQDDMVFDIHEIEDAMLEISEDVLLTIPQRPLHVPTFDDFEWMHPDFTEAQKAEFMARLSDVTSHIVSENAHMTSPVEEFSEGGSRALGFDLLEAARLLKVCHIGYKYVEEESGCVKDPAQKSNVRKVKKALKHHIVVDGEVREDPDETTRRHIRNAKMKASEAGNNPAIM